MINHKKIIFSLPLLFLAACTSDTSDTFINLAESANLIFLLVKTDDLHKVLEPAHNPEDLKRLIINNSPAEMAFEAEVLNHDTPVLLYFTETVTTSSPDHILVKKLAAQCSQKLKTVIIPHDKLFKITTISSVEELPTLLLIHHRAEITRWEKDLDYAKIKKELEQQLSKIN